MTSSALKGYSFGLLAALCWSISPVLFRKGLDGAPSPWWGTALGLFLSGIIYLSWFTFKNGWPTRNEVERSAVAFQICGGIAAGLGVSSRNLALLIAPAVVVVPLSQTTALFTLLLAPLILGRNVERVNARLIVGILILLAGSVLIVIGQNL